MAVSSDAIHLEIESWILYGITLFFIIARMISRRLLLGSWRKLQIDDYLMLFVLLTYTCVIVFVNETAQNLDNYLAPGVYETLSPDDITNAVFGSKCVFVTEEFMLSTLWLCKACLLILYSSLTTGLPKQHRFVKYVGGYCVFGFIVTQILFLGVWCQPIQQYWWVPVQNSQCASYYHHLITSSVFNITSDLVMLLIPLPILLKARLPIKRKAILCGVFSLGMLVILAAILNRYYNFTSGYGSLVYLNWYAGEASTAVMVANIPHCWPILSRAFRLGSFKSGGLSGGAGYADGGSQSTMARHKSRFSTRGTNSHNRLRSRGGIEDDDADSIERIVGKGVEPGKRDLSAAPPGAGLDHHHGNANAIASGGDMADLELGDLSSGNSIPAPKYEARATGGGHTQGYWTPGSNTDSETTRIGAGGGGLDDRRAMPSNNSEVAGGGGGGMGAGGIVKTVHLDQRYEGE